MNGHFHLFGHFNKILSFSLSLIHSLLCIIVHLIIAIMFYILIWQIYTLTTVFIEREIKGAVNFTLFTHPYVTSNRPTYSKQDFECSFLGISI